MKTFSRIHKTVGLVLSGLAVAATVSDAQTVTLNFNDVHQRIDGFGASCSFSGRTWSTNTANILFSTNDVGNNVCIGLSLLRNQIQPGGFASSSEFGLMKLAQERGARLWSTPWTPQASFKSNNNTVQGNFLSASNQAYAAQLANYVVTNEAQGVHIYALSIQNEPDANVTYVSCHWTAQQFHDFVPYLYTNFMKSNVLATKIILPESESWPGTSLFTTALSDTNVAAQVSIIANHNYVADNNNGDHTTPAIPNKFGKALWETEISTFNNFDGSISNGMYWATRIHLFLTVPEVNAWHYWYLITGTSPSDNEGLEGTGDVPAKRMYVLGQFSRFVRPNFFRVGSVNTANTLITAYRDSVSAGFAIVAINTNLTDITQTFNFNNLTTSSVQPWMTSATFSISNQPSVAVAEGTFTYTLPAQTVTTFVGQADNTAPTLAAIADQTNNVGVTLVVPNIAADAEAFSQTLTFSPITMPVGALLNSGTGIFSWRPPVSSAGTTNLIKLQVTDNGVPSLSATNQFNVVVNPVTQSTAVNSLSLAGGTISLTVNGPSGPDYTLLTTTNLAAGWQPLFTTNSPVPPFTFTDTNTSDVARFYRIQIGP